MAVANNNNNNRDSSLSPSPAGKAHNIPASAMPTKAADRNDNQVKQQDSFNFSEWDSLFAGGTEGNLVENAPPEVWGVLLSLSPKEYETVQLSSPNRWSPQDKTLTDRSAASTTKPLGYSIGRHRNCDIRIINPHVSNRHCLIYRIASDSANQDAVYLEDTSTNGTYINGSRIPKNKPYRLKDGDTVQLAKYTAKPGIKPFNDKFYMFQNLSEHKKPGQSRFHQNYLLQKPLGKGAFAEVREAINRLTGQRFAVKMIDRNRISTNSMKKNNVVTNFEAETSILLRVRHPNVVQIYGVYEEKDYFYLVLDLAKGGELFDEIIRCQFFEENQVRVIMLQLLLAICYLNRREIVHRDIKPENILLAEKDKLRVKLADFGLAKIVADRVFMKTVCGTPMYVAPEVLKAKQLGQYDRQVDMWSLGVVLYICLCGFPPFSDEIAPPPLKQQIIRGIYSFPSPNWDSISDGAKDLVERMLQVDPKERITVEDALLHPWLKAVCTCGGVWRIDGVSDFDVTDPEFSGESQTQSNSIGSPPNISSLNPHASTPSTLSKRQKVVDNLSPWNNPPTAVKVKFNSPTKPHYQEKPVAAAAVIRQDDHDDADVSSEGTADPGYNTNSTVKRRKLNSPNNENHRPRAAADNIFSDHASNNRNFQQEPSEELMFNMSNSTGSPPHTIRGTANKRKVILTSSSN